MSLNRTLKDWGVKKATAKILIGSQWRRPSKVIIGAKYRLEVDAGNLNGMINWGNEGDYNKVLLQIRVVPVGFRAGSAYLHKYKVEFYTDASYSTKVDPNPRKNYRTSFTLPEYKPTHADCRTYLYFKFEPGTPGYSLGLLRWSFGTYGAVRNHYWKSRNTSL